MAAGMGEARNLGGRRRIRPTASNATINQSTSIEYHGRSISYFSLKVESILIKDSVRYIVSGKVSSDGRFGVQTSLAHGWILWTAWGILGLYQVIGLRYMKPFWKMSVFFHQVTGYLIVAVTIVFSILGIRKLQWMLIFEGHNIWALIVFFGSLLLPISGYISRKTNLDLQWKTKTVLRWSKAHKVSAHNTWLIISLDYRQAAPNNQLSSDCNWCKHVQ